MKKIGCLLCVVCMWSMSLQAAPLQEAVERQVLTQEQAQYAAKQEFVMAVERFQFHAKYNDRDKDGFVKGTFELAQAYYMAVKDHSQLYAIELYGYMDRRMERPWKWSERTIASYILKSLKKKTKRVEFSKQRTYNKIQNIMRPIHENRRLYFPLIWSLSWVRTDLSTLEMNAQVAQGEVRWEDLRLEQIRQIEDSIVKLNDLGQALLQARPELLQVITEGLERDPLLFKNATPLNLEKFLVRYGMYNRKQEDGRVLVKVGNRMLAIKK